MVVLTGHVNAATPLRCVWGGIQLHERA
jgi:hypothetical protein